jgi:tetratricopeptide (TPR) repeat protein
MILLLVSVTFSAAAGEFDFTIKSLDGIRDQLEGRSTIEKIIALDQFIKNNNGFVELYLLKAEMELSVQDYIGARNTLQAALSFDPLNLQVLNLLGMTFFHLGERDQSMEWFEKARKIAPSDQFAEYYLSILDPFSDRSSSNAGTDFTWDRIDIEDLDRLYKDLDENLDKDFVYLQYQRELSVSDESNYEYTIHSVIKINSQKGADFFRNFTYGYNSYEFYPEVIRAGSYDRTYSFNEIDYKNIIVVDPADTSDYSMYTNKKEVAFPFHDLSAGSIIEFRIRFHPTGRRLTGRWFDYHMFGSLVRTMQSNYIIHYPADLAISFHEEGAGWNLETSASKDGRRTKKWMYAMPPRFDLDKESVTIADVSPAVHVGTYSSWEEIGTWYEDLFLEKLGQDTGSLPVVKQLKIENLDTLQQVQAIYEYIQKNIHYVGIELGESALIPHTPQEVITSRIGDCKDQAILMIYLLRSIGIEAHPALIPTFDHGRVIREIPSPYYFNHLVTWIPAQEGIENELFLDTTSTTTTFGNLPSAIQGVEAYIIKGADSFFAMTPVIDSRENMIVENYRFDIDLIGKGTVTFDEHISGAYAEIIRYSFKSKTREEILQYLFNLQKKSYNGLQKKNFKVEGLELQSGPLTFSLTAEEKDLTSIYFDGRQKLQMSINDVVSFMQFPKSSQYDYRRDFLYGYRKTMEYVFPDGYEITDNNLRNFSKENEYLYFHFIPEKLSENHFTIETEVRLKKRIIKKDDLSRLDQFIQAVVANSNYELILENRGSFQYTDFYEALIGEYNQKEVYENYIKRLFDDKDMDRALNVINRAIKSYPDDGYFYMLKANLYVNQDDYKAAEKALLEGLSENDKLPNLYLFLVEIYKKQQDQQAMERTLIEANDKFPGNLSLISEMTSFYNRLSRYDDSISFMKDVLSRDPENAGFHGDLGYIYSLKQDFTNAEKSLKRAIEIDNKNGTALNNLAWLYCEFDRNLEEAIALSERACELDPFNDAFFDTLAEVYFKNRLYDKAIEAIEKAISINPNYTYLQQQLDKIEKARQMQEQENR